MISVRLLKNVGGLSRRANLCNTDWSCVVTSSRLFSLHTPRAHSEASGAISFSSVTASLGDSTINNQVIGNKVSEAVFSSSVADGNINVSDDIVSKLSDINSDPTLSGTDVNTTEFSDDVTASVLADTAQNETFVDSPANEGFQSAFDSVETSEFVTNLKEIPFTELGLGHGWPSGWAQTLMEFFHIDVGLPWWQVIGATTVVLRIVVFPIVCIAQKNMVVINNHQPSIQKLQVEQQMASMRGETDKAVFAQQALNAYMSAHNCHPAKALWPIFVQGGFFMSMFFGLRGMTTAPVPSLTTGGLYWFQDLTLADPTYILPVLTCSTIYLQLYLGADGLNTSTVPPFMKKIMYILPIVSVPVMISFPAALNCYWLSNNIISVFQAQLIRTPAIRSKLGFGEMIKWKPDDLPLTKFQEEMMREMRAQQRKKDKADMTVKREKKLRLDEEIKRKQKLLDALDEEERRRKDK